MISDAGENIKIEFGGALAKGLGYKGNISIYVSKKTTPYQAIYSIGVGAHRVKVAVESSWNSFYNHWYSFGELLGRSQRCIFGDGCDE